LYLFVVLIVTFVSESRVMLALYSIGWGLPALLILLYSLTRATLSEIDSDHSQLCVNTFTSRSQSYDF
jgi:hypothetical protein